MYKNVLWNTSSLSLPHSPKVLTNPHITFKQKEPRNPAKMAGNVVVIPAITACISFNITCLVLVLVLVTVVLAVLLPINSIQPPAPAPPPQRGRRGNKQAHSRGWRGLLENARRTHICILQEQRSWVSLGISTSFFLLNDLYEYINTYFYTWIVSFDFQLQSVTEKTIGGNGLFFLAKHVGTYYLPDIC